MNSSTLEILIADDDPVILTSLSLLLNQNEGLHVAACVANGAEALAALASQHIDVALLDVDMPIFDGLKTAEAIKNLYPSMTVIVLTAFEHEDSLKKALELHIDGFLTKDIPSAQLAELIKQAHSGLPVMSTRPVQLLTQTYITTQENSQEYKDFIERVQSFPPYLRAVFDLLIEAKSNKAIAKTLALQESTVRNYVSEIMGTLRQSSRSELAITAIKAGFR